MPISGLLITLDQARAAGALAALALDARCEIGALVANRVPMTIDCADPEESRALTEDLRAISGVLAIDVVYVDFSADSDQPSRAVIACSHDIRAHAIAQERPS